MLRPLILSVVFFGLATYYIVGHHPELLPSPVVDHLKDFSRRFTKRRVPSTSKISAASSGPATKARSPAPATPTRIPTPRVPKNAVTLHLTNGGIVTGELVQQTKDAVTLRWEYGDVTFTNAEITRMVRGRQVEGQEDVVLPESARLARQWKYARPVVFRLLNGSVVDAELVSADEKALQLKQTVGQDGLVELTIPREQLDQLLFRPIENERSKQIRTMLEETFPDMHWYEEGCFTIVTDSIKPSVNGYRRVIRELAAELYLTYYPLLKGRQLATQQYLVIFDDWAKYIEYAQTDGVPGWLAVGYFLPDDEVLYLFNMMGERFSTFLYEAFLGKARQAVDQAVDQIKGAVDNRYEIFLDGLGVEIKAKFERADTVVRAGYRAITEETLRHELTHSLFHAWGLQTIVVSKLPDNQLEVAKKKREFLSSTDMQKKRELLLELLTPEGRQPIQTVAANSWVVEGLAAYMERSPGAPNEGRLYDFQQAERDQQVLPLEFLNTFRMGSFPGIAPKAQLYAYAQSWALVHFLMAQYPKPFLAFLEHLANASPQPGLPAPSVGGAQAGEELTWLLEATGRDLRTLEQEFRAYITQFPKQDPPWLVQYDALLEIFRSF